MSILIFILQTNNNMYFKFTKYGIINALLSLIPIFPAWTLFPGLLIGMGLANCIGDCVLSFKIVLFLCIVLIIGTTVLYLLNLKTKLTKEPKVVKRDFRLFSLFIYMLANTIAFIAILGPYLACNGSSMSVLACFYSGQLRA